jgi:hypothetical protein
VPTGCASGRESENAECGIVETASSAERSPSLSTFTFHSQ